MEKTPEKIYINGFSAFATVPVKEGVEYTRTDTFIEKACEFIAGSMTCGGYTLQKKAKFIRDFRNYMKGE